MDITSQFDLEAASGEGIVIELRNPFTGELLGTPEDPATVTVLGVDNSTWKKEEKRLRAARRNPNAAVSPDEEKEIILRCLAKCTLGTTLTFNGEKVTDFYTDLYARDGFHWIYEQVIPKAQSRFSLIEDAKKNSLSE